MGYKINKGFIWVRGPKLPTEYQEVEYIESSGTQYIDTGYKTNRTISTKLKIAQNMSYVSEYAIFGDAWSEQALFLMTYQGYFRYHYSFNGQNVVAATGDIIEIETSNTGIKIDGTDYSYTAGSTFSNYNIYIFNSGDNSQSSKLGRFKLYYFKLYDNGTLVRDFVPCFRKSDGAPGMYDLVTDTFFTNAGTGRFLMGRDIAYLPEEYEQVEYVLNTTGEEYINTGITSGNSFVASLSIMPTLLDSEKGFIGAAWTANDNLLTYYNGRFRRHNGGNWADTISASVNTQYYVWIDTTGITINGSAYNVAAGSSYSGNEIWFFRSNGQSNLSYSPRVRYYGLRMWNQGSFARDYVPCYRKSDGVIGFYDLVNNQFCTNSGGGAFTKGSDVAPVSAFNERQFYPGVPPTPPTPPATEIYYDLRGGSLNGLTAAGFNGIYTDGSYQFNSDGLGQTSGSNDRNTYVWTNQLDLSSATKVTIESLGYWIAGAWSNAKWLEIRTNFNGSSDTNPCFSGCINLNTDSPSYYSFNGLTYVNSGGSGSNPAGSKYASTGGDTTMTQVWDLVNKTWTLTYTGANSNSFSTTLSDAQVAEVKACKAAKFGWGRGYSSYNGERLKTVYIKIEY